MPKIRTTLIRERPLTSAKHRALVAVAFWQESVMHHAKKMHCAHTGAPAKFREASRAGGSSILGGASHAPCPQYAPRPHGSAR